MRFAHGPGIARQGPRPLRGGGSRAIVRRACPPPSSSPRFPCSRCSTTQERALLAERVETVEFEEGEVDLQRRRPRRLDVRRRPAARCELSVKTKTGEEMFLESPGAGRLLRRDLAARRGPAHGDGARQDRGRGHRDRSRRPRRALPPEARRRDGSPRRDRPAPPPQRDAHPQRRDAERQRGDRRQRARRS